MRRSSGALVAIVQSSRGGVLINNTPLAVFAPFYPPWLKMRGIPRSYGFNLKWPCDARLESELTSCPLWRQAHNSAVGECHPQVGVRATDTISGGLNYQGLFPDSARDGLFMRAALFLISCESPSDLFPAGDFRGASATWMRIQR
ncbi:hypothetical protein LIA77_06610 [Sarocladium implicatum]|nr:hypothetical protein LIA77_06610 [Sarocladium implicatum]